MHTYVLLSSLFGLVVTSHTSILHPTVARRCPLECVKLILGWHASAMQLTRRPFAVRNCIERMNSLLNEVIAKKDNTLIRES